MLEKDFREYKGQEPTANERAEEYQVFLDRGKVALNEWLYKYLPPEATLNDMDLLAGFIHHTVFEMWEAKKPNK